MAITPDTKDWTWVLERPCPDCGFDAAPVEATALGSALRANAATWAVILDGDPGEVRRRPREDRWSPLEYGCHVRDVFVLFRSRLELMLCEDDPLFANWDQDATAVEQRYNRQDPRSVGRDLRAAAAALAVAFDAVHCEQWARTGRRSDGACFTVDSFGRYLLHDPVHHLWDVGEEPQG